jgi:LCP family protein required for cell wall assembly
MLADLEAEVRTERAETRPTRRRRRGLLLVACVVAVTIAGVLGTLGIVQHRITSQFEYLDDPFASVADRPDAVEPAAGADAPVNILVLGSDSRISAGDPNQWEYGAQRTDAIMLVHISGDRQSVQVMSIPRDSWVPIPGHGTAKINAAFSWGGAPLMIETVEHLTGVRIDHVAIADFESFAAMTDQLGGVEITLPEGMDSAGVKLEPGTHQLSGDEALAYVRERYSLPRGDFDRVERQQNWMRAIMRAAFDSGITTDPIGLTQFLEVAAGSMAVDDDFTFGAMRDLAISMLNIRPGSVTFMTVPVTGTATSDDGQSIVELDRSELDSLMVAVANDRSAAYIEEHPELTVLGSDVR